MHFAHPILCQRGANTTLVIGADCHPGCGYAWACHPVKGRSRRYKACRRYLRKGLNLFSFLMGLLWCS